MKMDAAEPFNDPVDPIAMGIPVSVIRCFLHALLVNYFRSSLLTLWQLKCNIFDNGWEEINFLVVWSGVYVGYKETLLWRSRV